MVLQRLFGFGLVLGGMCCGASGQVINGTNGTQETKPTVVVAAPPPQQRPTDRKVPVLTRRITLADFVGMKPKAELNDQLTEIDDFIQSEPSDGKPGTQKTVAYVGRTATALYVVFACYDTDQRLIRGHLSRRENILDDDTVSVLVDPFQDHRRGVLFQTNAAGVQADAAHTDGNGDDYSYDVVWDSDGEVTRQGWMALFAIPFRSLRFRPGAQDWGVVLQRTLPRNSETDSWPHISTNISGRLTQEGTLRGITDVTGSHNIQINPYLLGQNEHELRGADPAHPYFSSRSFEGTGGGELKAVVKDAIVLDATVNPDFSTVESDQPQLTVNQRYPVYFPELRPFFLENANYFSTPITLLYTRDIVHPEFGARVTGKVGGTNVGLLLADDRAPEEAFAPGDADYHKRALYGVGRVSQDLGKGSSVGLMYTDYEFAGDWNRIGGADFTWRFNDKWTAAGQTVESSTQQGGAGGTYSAGPGTDVQVSRNGHSFNLNNEYQDYSAGFVSQVGFIQTANIRSDQFHATYQWYPKASKVQGWGLETNQRIVFDHAGNRVGHYTTVDPFVTLPGKTVAAFLMGENSDTLGPQDGYATLTQNKNLTQNFGGLVLRSAPTAQVNMNVVYTYGGNPNYNPVAGAQPTVLHENFLQALVSVLPVRSMTIDNTYLLDRNFTPDGQSVFENQVLRTKINYQFTRAFSARAIVEYDSLLVDPLQTSLVRTKQVSTSALLTWLPHPGTAVYVGYNNDIQNLDRALCSRLPNGSCDPTSTEAPRSKQYLNDGRQFFVKASYLFRF